MDLAYDHIVEESLPKEDDGRNRRDGSSTAEQTQQTLNAEIQDAYKAFSASPWGAKIGGFFGTVVKQVGRTNPATTYRWTSFQKKNGLLF